ncbi:MAG: hypothetical protein OXN83_01695, partial [Oligoflexia bacterium]|nr:hypothetical protein [Oligoflexia bacterium]
VFFALKYQYSFLDQGAWLFAKALFYVTSRAYTEVTIDILGAVDLLKNKTSKNRSLLNTFKHNDYFTWSVAYDF